MIKCLSLSAFLIAALACNPDSPSTNIVISAHPDVLKIGESLQLSAFGGGQPLRWSSLAPDICAITPSGVLTALRDGVATIMVSDGAGTVSTTITVVLSLDGNWSGPATTIIRRISGDGPFAGCCAGSYVYQFRAEQTHDQIIGHDGFYTDQALAGSVSPNRTVALAGKDSSDGVNTETQWNARSIANDQLEGEFVDIVRFNNAWGPQVYEYRNTFQIRRR